MRVELYKKPNQNVNIVQKKNINLLQGEILEAVENKSQISKD